MSPQRLHCVEITSICNKLHLNCWVLPSSVTWRHLACTGPGLAVTNEAKLDAPPSPPPYPLHLGPDLPVYLSMAVRVADFVFELIACE